MEALGPRLRGDDKVCGVSETLASLERLKQIQKNLKATVIIQHDPRDIGKLPAFPEATR